MTLLEYMEKTIEDCVAASQPESDAHAATTRAMLWSGAGLLVAATADMATGGWNISPEDYFKVLFKANEMVDKMPIREGT